MSYTELREELKAARLRSDITEAISLDARLKAIERSIARNTAIGNYPINDVFPYQTPES